MRVHICRNKIDKHSDSGLLFIRSTSLFNNVVDDVCLLVADQLSSITVHPSLVVASARLSFNQCRVLIFTRTRPLLES